jgi:hypothetical protein
MSDKTVFKLESKMAGRRKWEEYFTPIPKSALEKELKYRRNFSPDTDFRIVKVTETREVLDL